MLLPVSRVLFWGGGIAVSPTLYASKLSCWCSSPPPPPSKPWLVLFDLHCANSFATTCTYEFSFNCYLSSHLDYSWVRVVWSDLHLSTTCPAAVGQATWHVEWLLPELLLQVSTINFCIHVLYVFMCILLGVLMDNCCYPVLVAFVAHKNFQSVRYETTWLATLLCFGHSQLFVFVCYHTMCISVNKLSPMY